MDRSDLTLRAPRVQAHSGNRRDRQSDLVEKQTMKRSLAVPSNEVEQLFHLTFLSTSANRWASWRLELALIIGRSDRTSGARATSRRSGSSASISRNTAHRRGTPVSVSPSMSLPSSAADRRRGQLTVRLRGA